MPNMRKQILDVAKDASQGDRAAAIGAMLDDDWITDPKLLAYIIQTCAAVLADELGR